MRAEELALQADVSVDTVRFYQKQGLLEPPAHEGRLAWYSPEHLEAIARIKDLQRQGFSLALIRRSLAGELDPADAQLAVAVTQGLTHPPVAGTGGPAGGEAAETFDIDGLAARVGVPAEILAVVVDEGLLRPHVVDGEARFGPADVETLRGGLALVEAGLPLEELMALARHHHAVTRDVAARAVGLFDVYVRRPLLAAELDEHDRAERLVEAFDRLMPAVTRLVADHFRRLLLEIAAERFEHPGSSS